MNTSISNSRWCRAACLLLFAVSACRTPVLKSEAGKANSSQHYAVARETLACQAMRAVRDGAPETAIETLNAMIEQYPDDRLGLRMLNELRAAQPDAETGAD